VPSPCTHTHTHTFYCGGVAFCGEPPPCSTHGAPWRCGSGLPLKGVLLCSLCCGSLFSPCVTQTHPHHHCRACRGAREVFTSLRHFKDDLIAHPPDHFVCVPLVLDTLYNKVGPLSTHSLQE